MIEYYLYSLINLIIKNIVLFGIFMIVDKGKNIKDYFKKNLIYLIIYFIVIGISINIFIRLTHLGNLHFINLIKLFLLVIGIIISSIGYRKKYNHLEMESNEENLFLQFILSILTFGIYNLVCVYRITKYNKKEDSTVQLLLYMFVPFYKVYWVYQNAKEMDLKYNNGSEICTIATILSIFFTFVPTLIIQNKINEYEKSDKKEINVKKEEKSIDKIHEELKEYKKMLEEELITQEEYDNYKKKLLK